MVDSRRKGRSGFGGGPQEKALVALQSAITGDAWIKSVFTLVRGTVRCDFVGAFLRIEMHGQGAIGYRLIDSRGRDFSAELVDGRLFENHPAMPILLANPGIRFVNTRETLPPEEILYRSRFYREVMQVIGFRHAIGMFFWDDPPRIPHEVALSLARVEGQPNFNDDEVALLDRLYPHIDAALKRVRVFDRERAVRGELRRLLGHPSPACVLHWDLTVAEANREGREMCARWNMGSASACLKPPAFRLPDPLREACTELKNRWSASLPQHPEKGTPARSAIRHPTDPSLRATVELHVHRADSLGKPALLMRFEPSSNGPVPSRRKNRSAMLGNFTIAERNLIRLVSEGRSNQEIASATGRAVGTVKNALHSIFGKAGVKSRAALIARTSAWRGWWGLKVLTIAMWAIE